MTEPPDFILCGVGAPAVVAAIPGSALARCADCGGPITIAPSGQALVSAGAVAVCIFCGLKRVDADPDAEVAPVTAVQMAELWRAAGRRSS